VAAVVDETKIRERLPSRTVDRLAVNALAAVLVGLRGVPYVT
jgi:hypothetical protein